MGASQSQRPQRRWVYGGAACAECAAVAIMAPLWLGEPADARINRRAQPFLHAARMLPPAHRRIHHRGCFVGGQFGHHHVLQSEIALRMFSRLVV